VSKNFLKIPIPSLGSFLSKEPNFSLRKSAILNDFVILKNSVADPDPEPEPDPEGSETFGRIRIRSGTEINVLEPDSNPDPK
jgi:hypothetical protein